MKNNYVTLTKKTADALQQKLHLVKSAGLALKKLGTLEQENDMLKGMLVLIKKGHVDPHDCLDKFEDFSKSPDLYKAIKEASDAGVNGFGTVVDNPDKLNTLKGRVSAEENLFHNLNDLLDLR